MMNSSKHMVLLKRRWSGERERRGRNPMARNLDSRSRSIRSTYLLVTRGFQTNELDLDLDYRSN